MTIFPAERAGLCTFKHSVQFHSIQLGEGWVKPIQFNKAVKCAKWDCQVASKGQGWAQIQRLGGGGGTHKPVTGLIELMMDPSGLAVPVT